MQPRTYIYIFTLLIPLATTCCVHSEDIALYTNYNHENIEYIAHNKKTIVSEVGKTYEDIDLTEILDQKIYKNHYITNTESPNSSISFFIKPENKLPTDTYNNHSNERHNTAMQSQISRLNQLKRVEYVPSNKKDYIYGLGLSIPIDNNKK